jgi:hypothetical protein
MRRALAAAVLLALALAGCGGDSDEAESAAEPTTTTTTAAAAGAADTNFTGEGSEAFCGLARTYSERLNKLATSDPTQLKPIADEAEGAIREARAAAPPEIRRDVEIVAAASTDFFQQLARVNYDITKMPPDAAAVFQQPEVQTATQRVEAYSQKVCGITTTTVP